MAMRDEDVSAISSGKLLPKNVETRYLVEVKSGFGKKN
jgi:hypothetical protein